MPKSKFQKIDKAIEADIHISTVSRSGRLVLKSSQRTIGLSTPQGRLTPAGEYYYAKTGKEKPHIGFDPSLPLSRDGAREYVRMRVNTCACIMQNMQKRRLYLLTVNCGNVLYEQLDNLSLAYTRFRYLGARVDEAEVASPPGAGWPVA